MLKRRRACSAWFGFQAALEAFMGLKTISKLARGHQVNFGCSKTAPGYLTPELSVQTCRSWPGQLQATRLSSLEYIPKRA